MNTQDETTQALTDVEQTGEGVTTETSDEQEIEPANPRIVKARCLQPAWDSENCGLYVPGAGPCDGLFEIDADNVNLTRMTTTRGDWVFQFPGHSGKDPNFERRKAEQRRKKQGPLVPGSLSANIEAAFAALRTALQAETAALDAEWLALSAESRAIEEAAQNLEALLPAKARITQYEADLLAVAGKPEQAEAKRSQQRETEGAPAAMRARKKEIAERIEKIEDERQRIARRVFQEWFPQFRLPLVARQRALCDALDNAWSGILDFCADTAIPVAGGLENDLTAREHGEEKIIFDRLMAWFGSWGRR